ncbi:PKD domain-containing protein [Streptomyces sp. NPDC056883]|uniref:PKD domain-containing protein n=1 Tax=Streptomyces sp. NPDC056883 TaxID=3345959 RepID=UPI00368D3473
MRPTRTMALLTAGLVTLLGIPASAAAAEPLPDLYVNKNKNCGDHLSGVRSAPFCTIDAAVKAVKPGQTVRIYPHDQYTFDVTINRSGEPGKPITFSFMDDGSWDDTADQLTVSGASHVVFRGAWIRQKLHVSRSHDVLLEDVSYGSPQTLPSLLVDGGSTDVRVTRTSLADARIEGGSRRTVLSRNYLASTSPPLTVVDAPGTVITNNNIVSASDKETGKGTCPATLSISGTSTGSSVFNNLLEAGNGHVGCTLTQLTVSKSAASGTRADYNLIAGAKGVSTVPYRWAGTAHASAAAFLAASGQGAHDILVPIHEDVFSRSLLVDSADATAPGVLPVDSQGQPTADDPRVPNTGKNGGYMDRGAHETNDGLSSAWMKIDRPWATVGTPVTVRGNSDSTWPADMTYKVDFGDGTAPALVRPGGPADFTATHTYSSPCHCVVRMTAYNRVGTKVSQEQQIRATVPGPLTTVVTAASILPSPDRPDAEHGPLVVEVDTTMTSSEGPIKRVSVEYGDGTSGRSSALGRYPHVYKLPGTYEVTAVVEDSKGATSTAKQSVTVGYAPSGYAAGEPRRLLDTRITKAPVLGGVPTTVDLSHVYAPGVYPLRSMSAVVVNVTVTDATEDTHLTIWPDSQPRPATSNVNVVKGGTSSNTVTVPVGSYGHIRAQLNSGKASLIVDYVGLYQPNSGQRFSPLAPTRVLDTRTSGGALGGGKTRTVKVAGVNGIPADATAVALNLTGTGAKEQAHVIAYPDPAKRPATSNLNLEPGKDKSNQAIVPVGPNGTITLFTNTGSTHLILDAVGYYGKDAKALFTPVVPKRLADTRTTGKVAPGATTTVSGLPANALGAVLNITATDTTAPGFLTAYASGGTLPAASSLNAVPGRTVPNHVTTPVGPGGKVSIFNSYGGPNHVITDLLGYFTTG